MTPQPLNRPCGVDVLESSSAFCDLLAAARSTKFPGHWSGSAYRSHPCGVLEGGIKLTNEWSVYNYCSITITDGTGWSGYCTDSFSHGGEESRERAEAEHMEAVAAARAAREATADAALANVLAAVEGKA